VPGFQELLVIGLVAAIVIGPERLPKLAADVARLLARFRREAGTAVDELKSQVPSDGFGGELRDIQRELRDTRGVAQRVLRNELRLVADGPTPVSSNPHPTPVAGDDPIDTADRPSVVKE
jgi:sec-independent protein translocase protein TatB